MMRNASTSHFPEIEAVRRMKIVRRALKVRNHGHGYDATARRIGVPKVSLWRYLTAFEQEGFRGLVPGKSSGAPSFVAKHRITQRELAAMASRCRGRSIAEGVKAFCESPSCRHELRRALTHRVPRSLHAAIRGELSKKTRRAHQHGGRARVR